MAESPGQAVLDGLRRETVLLFERARAELEQAGALAPLGPASPAWAGFGGRLLERLPAPAVADPLATLLLGALTRLTAPAGDSAGLFGWDPDPANHAAPRGFALAVRTGDGADAFALALVALGGPRLAVTAAGTVPCPAPALAGGWTLRLSGELAAPVQASVGPDGPPEIDGPAGRARFELTRPDPGTAIGVPGGPALRLGAIAAGAELAVGADAGVRGHVSLSDGRLELAPGALSALLPGLAPVPLALDLSLDGATGLAVAGSTTLQTRIPVPGGEGLDIGLTPQPADGGLRLLVSLTTAVRAPLGGAPVQAAFEGIGLELPFTLGAGPVLGLDPAGLVPRLPSGAAVSLDLPVIQGAGILAERPNDEFAGALSVRIPPFSAAAFGLLRLPRPDRRLSLLAILGATFPPPGLQVGFGFAITGIGGIFGINCRVDRDALMRAVSDGSAAGLLFPTNPAAAADAAISALPAIFPEAPGSVVAGPMFQLSWGGRMVSASLAEITEISGEVRLAILGKVVVGIPDPELPLIFLQATFAGTIDPGEPSVAFLASLTGSRLVGMALSGDVYLLVRGGADPQFVLSAGGFHPAYSVPRGVPALRRIAVEISGPFLTLRCEAYLALTTGTVQFGARVELSAEVAGCGLRGYLGLDVLVQVRPHVHFIAEISAGISVEVFGESLASVHLDFALEGPAPWRARGRGSVDLFFFSVSFDFDASWGDAPADARPAPEILPRLLAGLEKAEAWAVQRPAAGPGALVLTPEADRLLGDGALVDPRGALSVRQQVVPLGVAVERFEWAALPQAERWEIAEGRLGDAAVPRAGEPTAPFAPGQFLALSDDELLSRPAFEPFRAGLDLVGGDVRFGTVRPTTLDYEQRVIVDRSLPLELELGLLEALEVVTAAADPGHPLWWPEAAERIEVAPEPPLAAASGWSMAAVAMEAAAPAATVTELRQSLDAAGRPGAAILEAWELGG